MPKTFAGAVYDVVDLLDSKRRWLPFLVAISLTLASLGLFANLYMYMVFQHQKGIVDIIPLVYLNLVLCASFILFSAVQIAFFIKMRRYLKQIEAFEMAVQDDFKKICT